MNNARRNFTLSGVAIALAATFVSLPARADDAADARGLVERATASVNSFAADANYASLPGLLGKAKAVLVYPRIIEGGFIIGGSGGSGVLLVRDEKTSAFVGPAFYSMGSVSIGFLAGGQAAEVILLVNSQDALASLLSTTVKLGAGASVAVGPRGSGEGAAITADFISFSRNRGAFANMSLNGQVIGVRETLNTAFYGKPASPVDILIRQSVSSPDALPLQAALASMAK
jgi:lipid-binding SYLF domain-containing protein